MVRAWAQWALTVPDVGNQTRQGLSLAQGIARSHDRELMSWKDSVQAAEEVHRRTGRSGGNGNLMRTAPVALTWLDKSPQDAFDAAVRISELTHFDPEAAEACGLWTVAIHHAVRTGQLDLRSGLALLQHGRQEVWHARIEVADDGTPAQFSKNGWVVEAFQSAWCAIHTTQTADRTEHCIAALEAAVRGGEDTDTVAAIAGSLIGAAHGESSLPSEWISMVHGWPGLNIKDLEELAVKLSSRR